MQETAAVLGVVWAALEALFVYARRSGATSGSDRRSLPLLGAALGAGAGGAAAAWAFGGSLPPPAMAQQAAALMLLGSGLVIRALAVRVLGRYFTADVTIQHGHRLLDGGIYRHLRHPGYLGATLGLAGLALVFFRWPVALGLTAPYVVALGWRIRVEERALAAAFGAGYEAYRRRTWCVVPGVF